jgi:hypothetical protein
VSDPVPGFAQPKAPTPPVKQIKTETPFLSFVSSSF